MPLSAGQYNDAAYSLVQLRKILEDSCSQQGQQVQPGSELAALQGACAECERSLEEVRQSTSGCLSEGLCPHSRWAACLVLYRPGLGVSRC